MRSVWVGMALSCLMVPTAHASQCSAEAFGAAVRELAQAHASLAALPADENPVAYTQVPSAAQRGILALKHALVATLDARLACMQDVQTNVDAMRNELLGTLRRVAPAPPVPGDGYGRGLDLRLFRLPQVPSWLLVDASFDIAFGNDHLLLVYAWRNGGWRRILRWQSGRYTVIAGAFSGPFSVAAIPADATHGPQLVVVHGEAWPTSVWRQFGLDVLAPGRDPDVAHVLLHLQGGYYLGYGLAPRLTTRDDGFALRTQGHSLDLDVLVRSHVYDYRESYGAFQRMQPVAPDPQGFVDEWLQSAWKDAEAWSDPAARARLSAVHAELAPDWKADRPRTYSYGQTRACMGDTAMVQVPLTLGEVQSTAPSQWYFRVRAGSGNRYTLLSVSPVSDPRCPADQSEARKPPMARP